LFIRLCSVPHLEAEGDAFGAFLDVGPLAREISGLLHLVKGAVFRCGEIVLLLEYLEEDLAGTAVGGPVYDIAGRLGVGEAVLAGEAGQGAPFPCSIAPRVSLFVWSTNGTNQQNTIK
jgi:hypothetical protein